MCINNENTLQDSWKPDLSNFLKMKEFICSCFYACGNNQAAPTIPDESYINNCAAIGAFLMDENAVLRQLKKLNTLLTEEGLRRGILEEEDNSPVFTHSHPTDIYHFIPHKKTLRFVLETELEKLGFKSELCKATDFIEPNQFQALLANGILLKDPGAGHSHGDFTHPLQWLAIGWQNEEAPFLTDSLINIFKRLGDYSSVFSHPSIEDSLDECSLWDIIVDLPKDTRITDCRCPDYLNYRIRSSTEPELFVLKILIDSRCRSAVLSTYGKEKIIIEAGGSCHKSEYSNKSYRSVCNISAVSFPEKISLTFFSRTENYEKQPFNTRWYAEGFVKPIAKSEMMASLASTDLAADKVLKKLCEEELKNEDEGFEKFCNPFRM